MSNQTAHRALLRSFGKPEAARTEFLQVAKSAVADHPWRSRYHRHRANQLVLDIELSIELGQTPTLLLIGLGYEIGRDHSDATPTQDADVSAPLNGAGVHAAPAEAN